jgi:tetratricopeptide (TPR) repeat protein
MATDERSGASGLDSATLIALGRLDEADELLRVELRAAGDAGDSTASSRALEGLGLVATRRGRDAGAIALFEQAIEVAGEPPSPAERLALYFELARSYAVTGRADRAVSLLETSLQLLGSDESPAGLELTLALAHAHIDRGAYGRAETTLVEAIRLAGELDEAGRGRARVEYTLARLYATTGRGDQAIAYARRAVATWTEMGDVYNSAGSHMLLAHVLLDAGERDEAEFHLAAARRSYGSNLTATDDGFLRVEEARLSLQRGAFADAAAGSRAAIEQLAGTSSPGEVGDANLVLARALEGLGDAAAAERAYHAAIDSLTRQNGWRCELGRAHRWYGKFLKRQGRAEAAMEALERAADLADPAFDGSTG